MSASPFAIEKPAMEQLEFLDVASGAVISTMAVELAPGVHRVMEPNLVPPDTFPRHGICKYVRRPDGLFESVAMTQGRMHKLTENIGHELGGTNRDSKGYYSYIKRLIWAGFVEADCQPDAYYVDLHSLFKFFRLTRNPGFWTKERRARYNAARDGVKPDPNAKAWPPAL